MIDLVAQRSSDFALARAWDQIVDEVEDPNDAGYHVIATAVLAQLQRH
ncbi:MAG TPA: hypothetical protein VES01_01385 [Dermatophilaceae bacterium]|nr:hypothetical protein [Dermatophilaceae bacterium]